MKRLENFEMPQRSKIQPKKISALIKRNPREVRNVASEVLRQIMHYRTGRANGCGSLLQAKTIERSNFEMLAQGVDRCFWREHPIFVTAYDPAIAGAAVLVRSK